jgi:SAM-dependent methyltransferase
MAIRIKYDGIFFEAIAGTSKQSAVIIVPLVLSLLQVNSVVDVGCGDGSWLEEFRRNGIDDVRGIDGAYVPAQALKIPRYLFTACDLKHHHLALGRQFDLAVSLETAEHLPPSRARSFVADLVSLSPQVLFSGAIPFQRGNHHVNCQWPDYWQSIFSEYSYVAFDVIRPAIWDDERVAFWYRQNTILYVRRDCAERNVKLQPISANRGARLQRLVHPGLCESFDRFSLREVMAMFPPTFKKAVEQRWRSRSARDTATR